MKIQSLLPRVALAALAIVTASSVTLRADATSTATTTPAASTTNVTPTAAKQKHHDHADVLSKAEKAQLKDAKAKVLAADPTLASEEKDLKAKMDAVKSGSDTTTDKKALHAQAKELHAKIHDAMVKADPTVAPILAKLESGKKHGHHHDA